MSKINDDANRLVKLNRVDWPALRELYIRNWPEHIMGFFTVDNFIRWTEKKPSDVQNVCIYSLDGDWSDGTFICTHRNQLFINTLNPSIDRLCKLVSLVDWSVKPLCCTILNKHRKAIDTNIAENRLETFYDSFELNVYYMPSEKAANLEINCPPEVTLGPLREEHAEKINSVWPYRNNESVHYVRLLIDLSPNVGAFDSSGKLVAWCLRFEAGPLGLLQVDEDHLRQGLGTLVCKSLSKHLGQMGLDVCGCVVFENVASMQLFNRIGFKVIEPVYWIGVNKNKCFFLNK